jgi:hypothetical protein
MRNAGHACSHRGRSSMSKKDESVRLVCRRGRRRTGLERALAAGSCDADRKDTCVGFQHEGVTDLAARQQAAAMQRGRCRDGGMSAQIHFAARREISNAKVRISRGQYKRRIVEADGLCNLLHVGVTKTFRRQNYAGRIAFAWQMRKRVPVLNIGAIRSVVPLACMSSPISPWVFRQCSAASGSPTAAAYSRRRASTDSR